MCRKKALGRLKKANIGRKHAGMAELNPSAILGGVVVGTGDPAEIYDVTHLRAHTLYPCEDMCMPMFRNEGIDARAIIVTIGRGSNVYEAHSLTGLGEVYGSPPPALTDVPAYDKSAWGAAVQMYSVQARNELERGVDERIAAPILALRALRDKQFRIIS